MPHKVWAVGEEVLAADFNDYVQEQVVATFPNAAARTAALPSPNEGQLTYLADLDSLQLWTGAAWQPIRYGATPQVTVAAQLSKTVIPASGGAVVIAMTGWASTPVVSVTMLTAFSWSLTIAAITATQVNIRTFETAGGTTLPDGAGVGLLAVAVGTPSSLSVPPTLT